ncbi:winged helix-turn-helix domain-containing protein [Collimonas humicola]|uniref:winged helix-turn-helix domain-containing protein n=1 Tax=Collimonas humicola TaxID=2825886 RepID=UPI001B8B916F|nr:winged helix-turn-helix domain-containing protein [Collimonas humicola]
MVVDDCKNRMIFGVTEMHNSSGTPADIDPVSAGFDIDRDGFVSYKNSLLFLPPKERGAFRLLLNAWPKVVSKEVFSKDVWAGRMSDESLARCITQLRRALSSLGVVEIDALYGQGYRLAVLSDKVRRLAAVPAMVNSRKSDAVKPHAALIEACIHARQLLEPRSLDAFSQAESILKNVIAKAPDYMVAKLLLAQYIAERAFFDGNIQRSQIDDALDQLKIVQDAEPYLQGLQSQRGYLLDCKWHFDEARVAHQQALQMFPDDDVAYYRYGWHLIYTASSAAVDAMRSAAQLNPFSPNIAIGLVRACACANMDPAEVLAQARSAYSSHPDSPSAYVALLYTLAWVDPQPEIAHAARHFVQKNRYAHSLTSRAVAYILARCGDHAGALEVIEKHSSAHGIHLAALIAMGMLDEAMIKVKAAAETGFGVLPFSLNVPECAALKQHPDYPWVHEKVFSRMPKK